jgi:hypothetical protein
MMYQRSPRLRSILLVASIAIAASSAQAADGQTVITHAKAMAGNVTPGDAAGYPVTLSTSGSYILGGELSPGPSLDAIVAASSDITIDLNGFKISGGPAGGNNNARHGILAQGDRLTVKNGTITGFEKNAIHAPNRAYLVVEHMRILNSNFGIYNVDGPMARIQNSTVAANVIVGIVCGASCHVESSVMANNTRGAGVYLVSGTVLGNTIASNGEGIFINQGRLGFGNNTLINNGTTIATFGGGTASPLHPNVCVPGPC